MIGNLRLLPQTQCHIVRVPEEVAKVVFYYLALVSQAQDELAMPEMGVSLHNMPEHLLFQDPSNQVYASIRAQDTPFSQSVRSYQYDWVKDLEIMFRTVLREKIRAGSLPEQVQVETFTLESADRLYDEMIPMVKEEASREEIRAAIGPLADEAPTTTRTIPTVDVNIDMSFPEVVQQDPIKAAQESEILHRLGLASRTELAARHGYNYKQSAKLMAIERGWTPEEAPEDEGRSTYQKHSDPPREPESEE